MLAGLLSLLASLYENKKIILVCQQFTVVPRNQVKNSIGIENSFDKKRVELTLEPGYEYP